uniref:Interleukin n=1 Tax=Hucho hucho TaxID=62062 RepID=A0A4W5RG66_9TELE
MENIFRIAFLMLFLSVGLQGRPANDKSFWKIERGINHLQKTIKCPEGTVFYAPSPADVEKSIAGALACSIQQLKHLNNTKNLQHHINKTLEVLQETFVDDIRTDSSECSSENPLFKRSCKEFMENMTTLAQALSAKWSQ